jgi:2-aminoadipate transaminase
MDYRTGITLDPADERPLYQQIVDQVNERVKTGAFPVGFRLPPTRSLAKELRTHRNTVVRAFEELQAMGLVTSTVGRGTFIAARPQSAPRAEPIAASGIAWGGLTSRRLEGGPLDRFDRLARQLTTGDTINLQTMQPSADLIPVEPFRRCMEHVLRTSKGRALAYGPREGLPALRQQVAEGLSRDGVPVRMDDVIITSGSQQAIDIISRALLDPGDKVLLEAPTYSGAINVFAASGATLVGVPVDAEGPSIEALSRMDTRGVKLLYLMPNCRNPTGSTISQARREAIVRWSKERSIPIIEDDYGADLNLDGVPPPVSLRALDPDVLYMGTFSKKLIPALRVGYLVCPPALRPHVVALKHATDLGTSMLLQHALSEFLDRGYMRPHLARVLQVYRERRDVLEGALAQHLGRDFPWAHVERAVQIWVRLPTGLDPEAAFRAAERRGVLVAPGTLSSLTEEAAPGVRLCFCYEPTERLREGARRLGVALREAVGNPEPRPRTAIVSDQLSVV